MNKNQFIEEIIRRMDSTLSSEQKEQLKENLTTVLKKVDFVEIAEDLKSSEDRMMDYQSFLLEYEDYIDLRGLSKNTKFQYLRSADKVLKEINKPINKITNSDVEWYLRQYKNNSNIKKTTYNNIFRNINSFFKWLKKKNYIEDNPMDSLQSMKLEKRLLPSLSNVEIDKIKCSTYISHPRDKAMIEIMLSTGCRVGELVQMNKTDIQYDGSIVVHGKGAKDRIVYLNEVALEYLKIYLNSRNDNNEALFVTKDAPYNRISIRGIQHCIKQIGKANDIKCTPHKFRRTMATNAINHGMDLDSLRQIMGHSNIDTTLRYGQTNKNMLKYAHMKFIN